MTPDPIGPSLPEMERQLILDTVARCGGNRTQAAKRLQISIRTLRNKLKQYQTQGCFVPMPRATDERSLGSGS